MNAIDTPKVNLEPLLRREELLRLPEPDAALLQRGIDSVLACIDRNLLAFGDQFPAPSSVDGIYPVMGNTEWTNGFWTGMLWLAYEVSGEPRYRAAAERNVESFYQRAFEEINIEHHDLGFLYTLSCVAGVRITGSQRAREAAIKAARLLLRRFHPQAGIIQAWGDLSDPEQAGRMIIDCNLNLPLLYWASEATGEQDFAEAANRHIAQAARYIVRPDASTFHTFYMDPASGAPRVGRTHQGYSDESCWARGQAWGISGFPLGFRYNGDASLLALSKKLANYFLNRLPADWVCCWDLIFTAQPHDRDSSSAAIVACGLLELIQSLPVLDTDRQSYEKAAWAMVSSLTRDYLSSSDKPGSGVLDHAVYHMPNRIGVDESCIWGDYFYLEALVRLTRPWRPYW